MKGIRLFLSVLLIPLVFQAAFADDEIDTSRAATRRGTTATVSSSRQKSNITTPKKQDGVSRSTDIDKQKTTVRERSTTKQVSTRTDTGASIINRNQTEKKAVNKTLSARTASNIQSRNTTTNNAKRVTTRDVPQQTKKSSGTSARTATNTAQRTTGTKISRSATDTPTITAEEFKSRNFSACKNVFFECMDEFCANKDSTLKRCACSARIHDFDKTKKSLEQVEDKLLDFSERLLTVNMDKEDALAMNTATEGELANIKDKTKSNQILDSIAKKLNTSFNDNNFNQGLNAISLSLNTDAAFDSVDSMLGASTTTKSGTALYGAALPICREMAMEVCSESDQKIAEESYQLAITQDCNLVQKSYEAQTEQARNKVFESGALLDMSRLDIYQKRNSDDILTCKRKMIDMLTDTTVCGDKMSKCLDTTGKYIDPSTGDAVLTNDLYELTNLIKRPSGEDTWRSIPENEEFVRYLNTKKIYLEPAMENCQDISEYVWESFIEDALAQIKLAQESKINELRQSCTTLTAQCMADAAESINDFDARAISIFGVKADYTVNQMCADIKNACTALINTKDNQDANTSSEWDTGITDIATEKTYETILATCREVGKNCIIRACSAISGNFGLCENIDTSINRKSIINRRSCWDEVEQCVADAGADAINRIMKLEGRIVESYKNSGDIYDELYYDSGHSRENKNIYDWAQEESFKDVTDGQIYRLTEQIWGNCERDPKTVLTTEDNQNKIIINDDKDNPDKETLLSWFARNTKTDGKIDSCRDTTCPTGEREFNGTCVKNDAFAPSGEYCPSSNDSSDYTRIDIYTGYTNCCLKNNKIEYESAGGAKSYNVCCKQASLTNQTKHGNYAATKETSSDNRLKSLCAPSASDARNAKLAFSTKYRDYFCVGGTLTYSSGQISCDNGYFVAVTNNYYNDYQEYYTGIHYTPTNKTAYSALSNFYYGTDAITYNDSTPRYDCSKYWLRQINDDAFTSNETIWYPPNSSGSGCDFNNLDKNAGQTPTKGWNVDFNGIE
ncbi:MAG: hypothetical protein ACLRFK_00310 [Alphaproteobacteria bacterium]